MRARVTAVLVAVVALAGLAVGPGIDRLAARFPLDAPSGRPVGARTAAVAMATGLLFALTGARFGGSWELPAYLVLAAVAVLLAVVDLRHRVLPNRIVVPALGAGLLLLALAAAVDGTWPALLRAGLAAAALFAVYLVLALISPSALGMGDVKLVALLGLYLGWLGWEAVLLGAAAGFVVQAAASLTLLAFRRVDLRGELPFGPAMLAGAALVIGATGL